MNVSDPIIQVLDHLCEKFGLAIDWTSENIIPYISTLCTKLVSYEIWTSVAWLVFAFIAGIVALIIATRPSVKEAIYDGEPDALLYIVIIIVLGILSIAGIITQISDIIKCVTLPEMYIFEYVQGVLNSGG